MGAITAEREMERYRVERGRGKTVQKKREDRTISSVDTTPGERGLLH